MENSDIMAERSFQSGVDGRALSLLERFGHDAVCWQILSPSVRRWFSRRYNGLVGYIVRGDYLISAGAPVAPPEDIPAVAAEFREFAVRQGRTACFLCAQQGNLTDQCTGFSSLCIGAQPLWDPRHWVRRLASRPGLRSQIRRAAAKGIRAELVSVQSEDMLAALEHCLNAWLAGRWYGMTFLAQPRILEQRLPGRLAVAAGLPGSREVLAFLAASPVPARRGYYIELIARRKQVPNGTTEVLIDRLMRHLAEQDAAYATLGLVALSRLCPVEWWKNPRWFRWGGAAALRFGQSLYHFSGLERFRMRLNPEAWEPVYAISAQTQFSPLAAVAIVQSLFGVPNRMAGLSVRKGSWGGFAD